MNTVRLFPDAGKVTDEPWNMSVALGLIATNDGLPMGSIVIQDTPDGFCVYYDDADKNEFTLLKKIPYPQAPRADTGKGGES